MNKFLNEASCEVDGNEYHAVTAPLRPSGAPMCAGCVGKTVGGPCLSLGPCTRADRADRSAVIWVAAE